MDNPSFTVEESLDGSSWTAAAGSPFTETSTTFSNNDFVASANMRYVRITTTNVYDLEVDALSYTNAQCCTTFSPTITVFQGTCNGTIPNEDGTVTISNILGAERADISTPRAPSYDGDVYAGAETVTAGSISFAGLLQQNSKYIVRIYEAGGACFNDISITTADSPPICPSPPAELPWNGSICGNQNILLQNGIAALSCGVTTATPAADRWSFALMNFDTILQSSGRTEETSEAEAYHHESWHVDSIGNVFGVAINNSTGAIFRFH